MVKFSYLISIIIYTLFSNSLYSQNISHSLIKTADIEKLNEKIKREYKNNTYCKDKSDINITNIYLLKYEDKIKSDNFMNKNFIKNLTPVYFKNYLKIYDSYLYNSEKKLVAISNGKMVYCAYHYSELKFLSVQKFIDKLNEIDASLYFFIVSETLRLSYPQYIFSVKKNDEILVLKVMRNNNMELLTIEKLVDQNWQDFVSTFTSIDE